MLAAAAESRPRRPAVDHFSIAEGCSPRFAQVTIAAAGKAEVPVDAADTRDPTGRLTGP